MKLVHWLLATSGAVMIASMILFVPRGYKPALMVTLTVVMAIMYLYEYIKK